MEKSPNSGTCSLSLLSRIMHMRTVRSELSTTKTIICVYMYRFATLSSPKGPSTNMRVQVPI